MTRFTNNSDSFLSIDRQIKALKDPLVEAGRVTEPNIFELNLAFEILRHNLLLGADIVCHHVDLGWESDHTQDLESSTLTFVDIRSHRGRLGSCESTEDNEEHCDVHFVRLSVLVGRVLSVKHCTGEVENSEDAILNSNGNTEGEGIA